MGEGLLPYPSRRREPVRSSGDSLVSAAGCPVTGMVLVARTAAVTEELSGPILASVPQPANTLMDGGFDAGPLGGCWAGMLNEFRNHLTIFLAGTTELSATLPGSVA